MKNYIDIRVNFYYQGGSKMKKNQQTIIFIAVFIIVLIIQIQKAQFGIGSSDEQFYTSMAYRIAQGGALIYDEWHFSQFMSLFTFPLIKIFLIFTNSTEGIIIYMRYCYVFFQMFIGTCLFLKFKNRGYISIVIFAIFSLYTPFGIMALSYNTMSLGFMTLLLISVPAKNSKNINLRFILSGILLSFAVLNTPYLAIIYVTYTIISFYLYTKKQKSTFYLDIKNWIYFTIGVLIIIILFALFIFSRASLNQILSALSFYTDPEYTQNPIIRFLGHGIHLFKLTHVFIVIQLILFIAIVTRKCKTDKLIILSIFNAIIAMIYLSFFQPAEMTGGVFMVVLVFPSIIGLANYIIFKNEYDIPNLELYFILPIIHSFLIAISSDVGPRSFINALLPCCIISITILYGHFKTYHKNIKFTVYLFIFVFISILLFYKIFFTYYNGFGGDFSKKINQGPLKNIYTSQAEFDSYNVYYSDMLAINEYPHGKIIIMDFTNRWTYLVTIHEQGANSSYIAYREKNGYLDMLNNYLSIHNDNYPLYVYISNMRFEISTNDVWFNNFDEKIKLNNGYLLIDRNYTHQNKN